MCVIIVTPLSAHYTRAYHRIGLSYRAGLYLILSPWWDNQ